MSDFLRERVCFYSSMFHGRSSAWQIARYAAKRGMAGVELMNFCEEFRTPNMATAREIGNYLRAERMTIPCFSVGTNLVGEDARSKLETLKGYADICAELEIPYLHHTVALYVDRESVAGREAALFGRGVAAALEICEYAARLGVKTIVENQGFIFNGVNNYSRFIKETDGKIGALLDVGNIMFLDERAESFYPHIASATRHVHIKDFALTEAPHPTRPSFKTAGGAYLTDCEIGTGDVDLEAIAGVLAKYGYGGVYSMEYSDCVEGEDEVTKTLRTVEKFFSKA